MIKGKIFFTILTIIYFITSSYAQDTEEKKFIQFKYTNLNSSEQVVNIETFIRSQEGVFVSRSDLPSKKFFIIFYSHLVKEQDVKDWMTKFNMQYKCWQSGKYGIDKLINLDSECE